MNMRWAGYLLIAIGLINWRYQNSFIVGAPLWIFGLVLIIGTYIAAVKKILVTKNFVAFDCSIKFLKPLVK